MGKTAKRKGEKPLKWQLLTLAAWVGAELFGFVLGAMFFGTQNLLGLMLLALISAVGGYLIVKAQLDKLPDLRDENDLL